MAGTTQDDSPCVDMGIKTRNGRLICATEGKQS